MHARIQAARENESGFTLIELLIVIVILGVLAGIVVFSVAGITDRGAKAACDANQKTVRVAAEAFYAQSGSYPAAMSNMVPKYIATTPTPLTGTGGDAKQGVSYALTAGAPVVTGGTSCTTP